MGISDIHMFDSVISADGIEGWVVSINDRNKTACVVHDRKETWVPIDELSITEKYDPGPRVSQCDRGPGPGGW